MLEQIYILTNPSTTCGIIFFYLKRYNACKDWVSLLQGIAYFPVKHKSCGFKTLVSIYTSAI